MFSCSAYKTSDELVTRFRRSVIFYRGQPCYVEGVDGMNLLLNRLEERDSIVAPSSDEALSIGTPTLGYVNHREGAVYTMRRPLRYFKQGLTGDNVCIRGKDRNVGDGFLRSREFAKMLSNNYPVLSSCFSDVTYTNPFTKADIGLKAFHKHLAVKGDELHHKGRAVGKIRQDKTFSLKQRYSYLAEEIEELLNEC